MLTAEQTHVAREAFEANRRRIAAAVSARTTRAGLGPVEPRLDRDAKGDYVDIQRRMDWNVWLQTWEAALASVGMVTT